jgi:hypothetical protein
MLIDWTVILFEPAPNAPVEVYGSAAWTLLRPGVHARTDGEGVLATDRQGRHVR